MKIKELKISNFRGLQNIEFKPNSNTSVIVGPNAIGKTTVLEGIRLVKGLLMPSYFGEEQEVINSIGGRTNQNNKIKLDYILGDQNRKLEISLLLEISDNEIQIISKQIPDLAMRRLRNTFSLQSGISEVQMIQFLSSVQGLQMLNKATSDVQKEFETFKKDKTIKPTLIIDVNGQIRGKNLFDQEIVSLLSSNLPPELGLFSYFPADRALPIGEVNIQFGTNESNLQLRTHIGQPQTKYTRLKQFIVNKALNTNTLDELREDFNLVFETLLPGKKLHDIILNPYGNFSVLIKEVGRNAVYDIDQMSSGEKGLLLTFFLMKRTVSKGGIILIDEPELHLNPAVQKKILPFIIEQVSNYSDTQIVICTHSPEILADAFENKSCSLFHLKSPTDISPIYSQDKKDVFEALKKLGASTSDVLSSKGSIFVEGEDDADIIEFGFQKKISGFKVIQLGGRIEVEKEIKRLQEEEKKGKLDTNQFFIFDLDRNITNLLQSEKVKISQWKRYCLENFLLDSDAIYDACSTFKCNAEVPSRGTLPSIIKKFALSQIKYVVAKDIYRSYNYENCGLRSSEIDKAPDFENIAEILSSRLEIIKGQFKDIDKQSWKDDFINKSQTEEKRIQIEWEDKFLIYCNGKEVLNEVFKLVSPNTSKNEFKKRILLKMQDNGSEYWSIIDSVLTNLLTK